MNWYMSLTIYQKINLKDLSINIVGVSFHDLGKLFSFKERIEILYNKLIREGFDI